MSTLIGIVQRLSLVGASIVFVLTWSSGFVIAKIGTDEAPALTVLVWRYIAVAGLLLIAIVAMRIRRPSARLPRWRDVRPHLTIGVFAQFGYVVPIYVAVGAGVSSGTTALIDAIQPLVVATLAGPLLGLQVRALQWVGLVLGAIGVALIVTADASSAVTPSPAYLLPLVALASLVAGTFLERRTSARLGVFATLTVHATVTLVGVTVLAFFAGVLQPPASVAFWVSTLVLALVPTLIAYGLYWYLLRRLGITSLNALLYLVAPTTAVSGAILFADPFTLATGAGLVLGAVAVTLVILPGRSETGLVPAHPQVNPEANPEAHPEVQAATVIVTPEKIGVTK